MLKTWIIFLGILVLPLQAFVQFQSLSGYFFNFFLIAKDFFVFPGPEYEHFNFILKAFLWAKGHFVVCL